ncbi:hypothetical protein Q7P37_007505 [Cladosporium fusiforme]
MASTLHHAAAFVLSAGTVTLDPQHRKVLFIQHQNPSSKTIETLLPKGRKDINEPLSRTAIRETLEETGHHVSLLPLPVPTLATTPSNTNNNSTDPSEFLRSPNTEPICVTERTTAEGVRKIIFWFAARADSTLAPRPKEEAYLQEGEDFSPLWVDFDDAEECLTFPADREVLAAVLRLVEIQETN